MLDILQCLGSALNSDPHKEAPVVAVPNTSFTLHMHENMNQRRVRYYSVKHNVMSSQTLSMYRGLVLYGLSLLIVYLIVVIA